MKTRQEILNHAKSLIGYTNYKLGAKWHSHNNNPNKPKYLDCSGFVVWAYKMAGFSVADGTYYQWNSSYEIPNKDLKIGDIGIKDKGGIGTYNHIGIYAGNGMWIHCNFSRNGITLEKTNMFKYFRRFNNINFEDDKVVPSSKAKDTNHNKKGDDNETVEKKEFIVNGEKIKLDTIFKDNKNYVSLQSLKKAKLLDVHYDPQSKTITLSK